MADGQLLRSQRPPSVGDHARDQGDTIYGSCSDSQSVAFPVSELYQGDKVVKWTSPKSKEMVFHTTKRVTAECEPIPLVPTALWEKMKAFSGLHAYGIFSGVKVEELPHCQRGQVRGKLRLVDARLDTADDFPLWETHEFDWGEGIMVSNYDIPFSLPFHENELSKKFPLEIHPVVGDHDYADGTALGSIKVRWSVQTSSEPFRAVKSAALVQDVSAADSRGTRRVLQASSSMREARSTGVLAPGQLPDSDTDGSRLGSGKGTQVRRW